MLRRATVVALVAVTAGLLGLLGPGPATAGAQAAEPTFTVTPSTDLLHQQVVRIDASGFPAGALIGIFTCAVGVPPPSCGIEGLTSASVGPDGSASFDHRAWRYPRGFDCTVVECELAAAALLLDGVVVADVRRPVSFAPDEGPEVSVVVEAYGTVDDDGLAVVSAVISCDRPVDVVAVGEVRQDDPAGGPDLVGSFSFTGQPCAPGDPVHGFFPTRDRGDDQAGPYAPGPAVASVHASPASAPGREVAADAEVTLLDQEGLVAALLEAIADPANVALRDAVVQAIRDRVRQDPVFAAEWRALLAG